jgi:hypothetical protein
MSIGGMMLAVENRRIQTKTHLSATLFTPGVFNLYLLKGHILMAERFMGRIHVLQSKVCTLFQDMPTNIFLHKHT